MLVFFFSATLTALVGLILVAAADVSVIALATVLILSLAVVGSALVH